MKTTREYRGYRGSIEVSIEDDLVCGLVLGVRSVISYAAEKPSQIQAAFEAAVDDYLELCVQLKVRPEKSMSGSFNVRVGEEVHREAAIESELRGVSLNEFVRVALVRELKECRTASIVREFQRVSHIEDVTIPASAYIEQPQEMWLAAVGQTRQ